MTGTDTARQDPLGQEGAAWCAANGGRRVVSVMRTITIGTRVIIHPHANCDGGGRPHNILAEDGRRGVVTGDTQPGDHHLFVLFKGIGSARTTGERLPLGRCYRPDELEPIGTPTG